MPKRHATQKERNDYLYARVQSGDIYAAHCLVEENLPLVNLFVGDFLRRRASYHELDREEAFAEACLALCQFVHRLTKPHRQVVRLHAALRVSVSNHLSDWCENQLLLGPKKTVRRAKRESGCTEPSRDDHVSDRGCRDVEVDVIDELDELSRYCQTDRQKQIALLAAQGTPLRAIAGMIGISEKTVSRDLDAIHACYSERSEVAA